MLEMVVPTHQVVLLRNLYANQKAGSVIFFGVRIRLGTILGRFSIIYFRGLGLWFGLGFGLWFGLGLVLWLGLVWCYGQGKFRVRVRIRVRVGFGLGL